MGGTRQAAKPKSVKIRIEPHSEESQHQWMCRCTKNNAIKHNALLLKKQNKGKLHLRVIAAGQCMAMWLKARRLDDTTEGNII